MFTVHCNIVVLSNVFSWKNVLKGLYYIISHWARTIFLCLVFLTTVEIKDVNNRTNTWLNTTAKPEFKEQRKSRTYSAKTIKYKWKYKEHPEENCGHEKTNHALTLTINKPLLSLNASVTNLH